MTAPCRLAVREIGTQATEAKSVCSSPNCVFTDQDYASPQPSK